MNKNNLLFKLTYSYKIAGELICKHENFKINTRTLSFHLKN